MPSDTTLSTLNELFREAYATPIENLIPNNTFDDVFNRMSSLNRRLNTLEHYVGTVERKDKYDQMIEEFG